MNLVVGVDAGASKTRVAVARADTLEVVALHDGPEGAVAPNRVEAASTVIAKSVRTALARAGSGEVKSCVVGAAGVGRPVERNTLRADLNAVLPFTVIVDTDAAIAYRAGLHAAPGVLLIVGTGAIALARDVDGAFHQVGGYGSVFADEIGGYNLGRGALAAVAQAHDGRGPPTELNAAILTSVGIDSFDALASWANGASRTEIATLGAVVLATASSGDEVASALVEAAATHLVAYVVRAAEVAQLRSPTIVMCGGLVGLQSPLRAAITDGISTLVPGAGFDDREVDPVLGAIQLAHDLL